MKYLKKFTESSNIDFEKVEFNFDNGYRLISNPEYSKFIPVSDSTIKFVENLIKRSKFQIETIDYSTPRWIMIRRSDNWGLMSIRELEDRYFRIRFGNGMHYIEDIGLGNKLHEDIIVDSYDGLKELLEIIINASNSYE